MERQKDDEELISHLINTERNKRKENSKLKAKNRLNDSSLSNQQNLSELHTFISNSIKQKIKLFGSGKKGLFLENFVFENHSKPGPADYFPHLPNLKKGPIYRENNVSIMEKRSLPGPGSYELPSDFTSKKISNFSRASSKTRNGKMVSEESRNRTVPMLNMSHVKKVSLPETTTKSKEIASFEAKPSNANLPRNEFVLHAISKYENKIDELDFLMKNNDYNPFMRYISIRGKLPTTFNRNNSLKRKI